ncbi:SAM-dependent methyltransferase [Actinospica robiniae]|uniref:SAM-dependent methyltransferase n=1 Tax=Actinospica robiniae TaxID=304901 RepID=UPI00040BBEF3|nr:SAM-dependent methyltransferase [Actinospica robiniae]
MSDSPEVAVSPLVAEPKPPVGVDPTRASIARVYDAFLNGKDNYAIDRAVLAQVQEHMPTAQELAFENRGFLTRACRFLVLEAKIDQFLDLGSGLPTAENVHQVVQRINSEAEVVYVDNDPVVLAHGRALLEANEHCRFIAEDIFEPKAILSNEVITRKIDFTRPLALVQSGTLHHYSGPKDRPAQIMREYIEALPSGSFVVLSHFFDPENEYSSTARDAEQAFLHSPMGSGTFRTQAQLLELFAGLELVEPGLVRCADWWPDGPRLRPLTAAQRCIAGAVGRKP